MEKIFLLLCEEIRNELGGAQSLIGVFPPGGIRAMLPSLMPKFGLFAVSEWRAIQPHLPVKLKITAPGDENVLESPVLQIAQQPNTEKVFFSVNMSPMIFKTPGNYSIALIGKNGKIAETTFSVQSAVPLS